MAGSTNEVTFPATPFAYRTAYVCGQYDGTVTRLDMLPTGVTKYGITTASCQGPIFMLVNRMPVSPAPGALTPPSEIGTPLDRKP